MSLNIEYPEYWMILRSIKITKLQDLLCDSLVMMEWGKQSAIFVAHLKFKLNWMSSLLFSNEENIVARVVSYKISRVTSVTFELTKLYVSLSLHIFKVGIYKTYLCCVLYTYGDYVPNTT